MNRLPRVSKSPFFFLFLALTLSGCATIREVAALHRVHFSLDRLSDLSLAGISLNDVKSHRDLGLVDVGRLALAISDKNLPLTFTLHLKAENPADNPVAARLIGMSWTLFIQDKETINGTLAHSVEIPPGEPRDVPVIVDLNLVEFFEEGIHDLIDLASSLKTKDTVSKHIRLQVIPTIDTALGPIRYPTPITLIGIGEEP